MHALIYNHARTHARTHTDDSVYSVYSNIGIEMNFYVSLIVFVEFHKVSSRELPREAINVLPLAGVFQQTYKALGPILYTSVGYFT